MAKNTDYFNSSSSNLPPAPETITRYKEIAIHYPTHLPNFFNTLSSAEKIFIYYMYRASIPGTMIAADQTHRHSIDIITLFETLYNHKDLLKKKNNIIKDIDQFIDEIEIFLVYLWTNNGQYFAREHAHEKRTPEKLNLTTITYENLLKSLEAINNKDAKKTVDRIAESLFNSTYEDTATIPNNIEKSAINFYSPDFTYEDYCSLDPAVRSQVNAYFYIDNKNNTRTPKSICYSTDSKYKEELTVAVYWLEQAYSHAQNYPDHFDKYSIKSLEYLIEFLKTGDENFFKKHSIEWLKSQNKIDYNFGFIETYQDPQSHRGSFQAEVTIKTISIDTLNQILPQLESLLPFEQEFKRVSLDSIPNASINTQVFGTGDLGPQKIVAAYCLPNYEDIRCSVGSKQIIYQAESGLSTLLNPELSRKLTFLSEQSQWLEAHDKHHEFINDLWNIHCILHETIGHASGKLANHIFEEDDQTLTIENCSYKPGDVIEVTNCNLKEFLAGYEQTIEELRAEIIALYISIEHLEILKKHNLLKHWPTLLNDEELESWLIIEMAQTGLKRLLHQPDNASFICGDHARANYTILNYLIEHGGLELLVEQKNINNNSYHIPGLRVTNLKHAKKLIKELMIIVQEIKSTGNGKKAHHLIETYGTHIKDQSLMNMLKHNNKILVGDLKTTAYIYPRLTPIVEKDNNLNKEIIKDIQAEWPETIFEQHKEWKKHAYSTLFTT